MKMLSAVGSTLVASLFVVASVGSANAQMYQEQSQSSNQSSNFSFSCSGSCGSSSGEFKSSSELKQSQSQSSGFANANYGKNKSKSNYGKYPSKSPKPTNGRVTIGWEYDEGTCFVRYSEANSSSYKYSTSAACSNGETTVGGLRVGGLYRFQIKQDDGEWSDPIIMRAY